MTVANDVVEDVLILRLQQYCYVTYLENINLHLLFEKMRDLMVIVVRGVVVTVVEAVYFFDSFQGI